MMGILNNVTCLFVVLDNNLIKYTILLYHTIIKSILMV